MADSFDRLKTALSDRYAIDEEIGAGGKNVDYGHHLRERPGGRLTIALSRQARDV